MRRRSTRARPNWGFLKGSLLFACLVGVVVETWWAFGIALALALGANLWADELRFKRH